MELLRGPIRVRDRNVRGQWRVIGRPALATGTIRGGPVVILGCAYFEVPILVGLAVQLWVIGEEYFRTRDWSSCALIQERA